MENLAINHQKPRPVGFLPGKSGNPSGRPRRDKEVAAIAREHTAEAIRTLLHVMTKPKASDSARVSAAQILLDRGWGRAPQSVELSGPGGGPIAVAELGQVERRQLMLELQARLLEASVVLAEELPPAPASDAGRGPGSARRR